LSYGRTNAASMWKPCPRPETAHTGCEVLCARAEELSARTFPYRSGVAGAERSSRRASPPGIRPQNCSVGGTFAGFRAISGARPVLVHRPAPDPIEGRLDRGCRRNIPGKPGAARPLTASAAATMTTSRFLLMSRQTAYTMLERFVEGGTKASQSQSPRGDPACLWAAMRWFVHNEQGGFPVLRAALDD
jgi:hypothetical protein